MNFYAFHYFKKENFFLRHSSKEKQKNKTFSKNHHVLFKELYRIILFVALKFLFVIFVEKILFLL